MRRDGNYPTHFCICAFQVLRDTVAVKPGSHHHDLRFRLVCVSIRLVSYMQRLPFEGRCSTAGSFATHMPALFHHHQRLL